MKKIKLCIFDVDGLLLNTEKDVWMKGGIKVAKDFGKELTEEFITDLVGLGFVEYRRRLKNKFGQDFPADLFVEKLFDYFENTCLNEKIEIKQGVLKLFDFLKKNNILISIGTSTHKYLSESALKNAGLYDYLDFAVFGDQVTKGKPDPEIYLKSVEHFNLSKDECIIFEDGQTGAKAAYAADIKLVLVPDLTKPSELDKEKAFTILNSIDEIIPTIKKLNNIK